VGAESFLGLRIDGRCQLVRQPLAGVEAQLLPPRPIDRALPLEGASILRSAVGGLGLFHAPLPYTDMFTRASLTAKKVQKARRKLPTHCREAGRGGTAALRSRPLGRITVHGSLAVFTNGPGD
jgi:hypothetical protein